MGTLESTVYVHSLRMFVFDSRLASRHIVRYKLPSFKYGFFYLRIEARHISTVHSFEVY